jgi:hypothetical protein
MQEMQAASSARSDYDREVMQVTTFGHVADAIHSFTFCSSTPSGTLPEQSTTLWNSRIENLGLIAARAFSRSVTILSWPMDACTCCPG